ARTVFCLALCLSASARKVDDLDLNARITAALGDLKPGWKPVASLQSGHILMVPSEKRILTADWHDPQSPAHEVTVSVYAVANSAEATAWLAPIRNRQVAPGWKVTNYNVGDEGYLSEHSGPRRFDVQFRSGVVVAKISASDLRLVKEFAA